MKKSIAMVATLVAFCLVGCKKENPGNPSALTIKLAGNTEEFVYPIGSIYWDDGDFSSYETFAYRFYQEKNAARQDNYDFLLMITGRLYSQVEYTVLGQGIDSIYIKGLDESLRLGSEIFIPMEQGKYQNGNERIRDVRINSFFPSEVDIVITTMEGDVITIYCVVDVLQDE